MRPLYVSLIVLAVLAVLAAIIIPLVIFMPSNDTVSLDVKKVDEIPVGPYAYLGLGVSHDNSLVYTEQDNVICHPEYDALKGSNWSLPEILSKVQAPQKDSEKDRTLYASKSVSIDSKMEVLSSDGERYLIPNGKMLKKNAVLTDRGVETLRGTILKAGKFTGFDMKPDGSIVTTKIGDVIVSSSGIPAYIRDHEILIRDKSLPHGIVEWHVDMLVVYHDGLLHFYDSDGVLQKTLETERTPARLSSDQKDKLYVAYGKTSCFEETNGLVEVFSLSNGRHELE